MFSLFLAYFHLYPRFSKVDFTINAQLIQEMPCITWSRTWLVNDNRWWSRQQKNFQWLLEIATEMHRTGRGCFRLPDQQEQKQNRSKWTWHVILYRWLSGGSLCVTFLLSHWGKNGGHEIRRCQAPHASKPPDFVTVGENRKNSGFKKWAEEQQDTVCGENPKSLGFAASLAA